MSMRADSSTRAEARDQRLEAVPPVEPGRQADGEPLPYQLVPGAGTSRVVLARLEETAVSRRH